MQRSLSLLTGICLILLGIVFLAGNLIFPILGLDAAWFQPWRLWPLVVIGVGVGLLSLTALALKRPGFGTLFIPALPVLTTGAILFFASLTNYYQVWAIAWPLVILSLALGFVLAALATRIVWLGIPAIMIGVNGAMLAFCAWTGLWSAWAVLWPIEPAAVGLVILLTGVKVRSWLVAGIGFLFFEAAWMGVFTMVGARILGSWAFRLMGPGLLIVSGGALLLWALLGQQKARLE